MPSTPTTLAAFVRDALERHSEHLCLVNPDGRRWSYGEVNTEIERLHALFHRSGLRPGERVGLLGANSAQWCLVYLAAVTYGVTVVPILPDFPAASVHNILELSGARAIFVSASLLDRLRSANLPELRHAFVLEDFSEVPLGRIGDLLGQIKARVAELRERAGLLLEPIHPGEAPAPPSPEDIAAIVYTSGTTGSSKGVILTQGNIVSDVVAAVRYVVITPADRMLSLLPLAHTYECSCGFLGPFGGGASFWYIDQKPSPSVLLAAFAKVQPTLVFAVPLVMEKIYRKKVRAAIDRGALLRTAVRVPALRRAIWRKAVKGLMKAFGGHLRQMGFGGAPLPPEVERFLREGGFPYFVGYGMTECAPLMAGCRPEETRMGSCGYPVEGIELRIADADPRTGIGEVQVRGPMVTPGYYRNADATAALFTADGWMRSGDLGRLDADRFLYLKGRSKNMFLGPSGENIYPEEIEQLLGSSPLVAESLVLQREHRMVAIIVPDYEVLRELLALSGVDEAEAARRVEHAFAALVADVNHRLPAFSRIATHEIREAEFEKTPTQKVKRYLYG